MKLSLCQQRQALKYMVEFNVSATLAITMVQLDADASQAGDDGALKFKLMCQTLDKAITKARR